jgi:hypothetical protein
MKLSLSLLILLLIGSIALVIPNNPALACSFGPQPGHLEEVIEQADYVLRATVIELDDADQNMVLEARQYFKGGAGPRWMLLHRTDTALSAVYEGHHYNTGCLYGGPRPIDYITGFFALTRADEGYYFPLDIYYHHWYPELRGNSSSLTVEEYSNLLIELTGEEPVSPDHETTMPTLAPLSITTEDGSHYVWPADNGEIYQTDDPAPQPLWSPLAYPDLFNDAPYCAEVSCRRYVSDLSLFAELMEENTIQVDFPYRDEFSTANPLIVSGDSFMFSTNGRGFIAWNDAVMTIYEVTNNLCDCGYGDFVPHLNPLLDVQLNSTETFPITATQSSVRWSADDTTLAYTDADGLWILDLYRQTEPELIVPADELIPIPLYLSSHARYLAYATQPEERTWTVLDRISGATLPNVIVSPDERFIAYINVEGVYQPEILLGCSFPMQEGCRIAMQNTNQFEWIGQTIAFGVNCADDQLANCRTRGIFAGSEMDIIPGSTRYFPRNEDIGVNQFDFEPHSDAFALITSTNSVRIYSDIRWDLNVEVVLPTDSPIVDVEWQTPLFYFEPEY